VRVFTVIGAVVLVVSFAHGAAADGGGRAEDVAFGGGRLWTTVIDRVVAVDPTTGRIAGPAIPTGGQGTTIAATNRTLWRLQPHSLVAVDVSSRRVRLRVGLGQAAYALAAGYGAAWVPSFESDTLTKIDGRTGARRWRIRVPHSPQAVATGSGSVWVVSIGRWHSGHGGVLVPDGPGIVVRVDPATGAVRRRIRVDRGPNAIALGAGAAWVLNGRGVGADNTLDRIDSRTNHLLVSISVPRWSAAVAVGHRYAWVVSEPKSAGGVVTRVDIRTNRTVTRRIPRSWIPAGVVLVGGGVWIADPGVAQLIRLDPHTLTVTRRVGFPIS
jgi:DNA-binding beta-propeller fold protein YncE